MALGHMVRPHLGLRDGASPCRWRQSTRAPPRGRPGHSWLTSLPRAPFNPSARRAHQLTNLLLGLHSRVRAKRSTGGGLFNHHQALRGSGAGFLAGGRLRRVSLSAATEGTGDPHRAEDEPRARSLRIGGSARRSAGQEPRPPTLTTNSRTPLLHPMSARRHRSGKAALSGSWSWSWSWGGLAAATPAPLRSGARRGSARGPG